MTKGDNGVWEATVGPVPAGAYRYHFNVDGLAVVDPRNPATSESNTNIWSLAVVPGSDAFDTEGRAARAVAEVNYYSQTLKRNRRMHVYTPPGYEKGDGPVPGVLPAARGVRLRRLVEHGRPGRASSSTT